MSVFAEGGRLNMPGKEKTETADFPTENQLPVAGYVFKAFQLQKL